MSVAAPRRVGWLVAAGGTLLLTALVIGQGALASLKVTDEQARGWLFEVLSRGGPTAGDANGGGFSAQMSEFAKLSPAMRAATTTQLYAWAKAYVNTSAFKAAYAKNRADLKPVENPHEHSGTVEDELKVKLAEKKEEAEQMFKMLESMGQKDNAAKMRQEFSANLKLITDGLRLEIVEHRAQDKKDYDLMMKQWETNQPPDSRTLIARILREFLETTTDIDFAAKQKMAYGEAGSFMAFANEGYNKKPWQWQFSYLFGPDAIAAARSAAQQWLKELGG
jgi:hypothetical protein